MSLFTLLDLNEEFKPDVEPRYSALVCFPVEFIDGNKSIPGTHMTLHYFPDVSVAEFTKEDLIAALRDSDVGGKYQVVKVYGVDAFGPEKDVPVLRLSEKYETEYLLRRAHRDIKRSLKFNMVPDYTWGFDPHVTVDLATLVDPPDSVLLRPMELWWMDDEPVVI